VIRWAAALGLIALGCGSDVPPEPTDAAGAAGSSGGDAGSEPVAPAGRGGSAGAATSGNGGAAGEPVAKPCETGVKESCRTDECGGVKECVAGEWAACVCVAQPTGGTGGVATSEGGEGGAEPERGGSSGAPDVGGSAGGGGGAGSAGMGGAGSVGGEANGGTGGAACVSVPRDEACSGTCGQVPNGCGGVYSCGGCPAGKYCRAETNVCVWYPECDCQALGFECGGLPQSFGGADCPASIACGYLGGESCATGQGCFRIGDALKCSAVNCVPSAANTCTDQPEACGVAYDGCSGIYSEELGEPCPRNCGPG
jgi:hypothetical protein